MAKIAVTDPGYGLYTEGYKAGAKDRDTLLDAIAVMNRYMTHGFMDDVRGDVTVSDDSAIAKVRRALYLLEARDRTPTEA